MSGTCGPAYQLRHLLTLVPTHSIQNAGFVGDRVSPNITAAIYSKSLSRVIACETIPNVSESEKVSTNAVPILKLVAEICSFDFIGVHDVKVLKYRG